MDKTIDWSYNVTTSGKQRIQLGMICFIDEMQQKMDAEGLKPKKMVKLSFKKIPREVHGQKAVEIDFVVRFKKGNAKLSFQEWFLNIKKVN